MTTEKIERNCKNCGNAFELSAAQQKNSTPKIYCSKVCKNKFSIKAASEKVKNGERKTTWEYVKSNPEMMERHLARGRAVREKTRLWLWDYKMARGCFDCGYKAHPAALQLDHEGSKSIEISAARSSIKRVQKEITDGKCVVRCANCHSIVTWERKTGRSRKEFE